MDASVDSIEHGNWLDPAVMARLGARGGGMDAHGHTPGASTCSLSIEGGHFSFAELLQRHFDAFAATLSGAVVAGVVVHGSHRRVPAMA